MSQVNLNIESLTATNQTFIQKAQELEDLTNFVNNTLQSTEWQSPAAEAFRGEWQQSYMPSLQNVQRAMVQYQTQIAQQLARYIANEGLSS